MEEAQHTAFLRKSWREFCAALPPHVRTINPAKRRAQLQQRRRGVYNRFCM